MGKLTKNKFIENNENKINKISSCNIESAR